MRDFAFGCIRWDPFHIDCAGSMLRHMEEVCWEDFLNGISQQPVCFALEELLLSRCSVCVGVDLLHTSGHLKRCNDCRCFILRLLHLCLGGLCDCRICCFLHFGDDFMVVLDLSLGNLLCRLRSRVRCLGGC